jgi:hypothetical protein
LARIDDFRAHLAQGGARPTQFKVNLSFPTGIGVEGIGGAAYAATFMCSSASIPASTIQSIDVPYRGRTVKLAGERVFQNWQVRVLNDGNFAIRKALESWSAQILSHESTTGFMQPNSYVSDMEVVQLDRDDMELRKYRFHNCFPTNISEISLDFGQITQIEEFNVEFSVDYWTVDTGDVQII